MSTIPNRSARIALVVYEDGEKRYILAPVGLSVDDTITAGPDADIRPGNALPIRNIPLGTIIHNIELYPGRGGQLVRSAGNSAQLVAKEGQRAQVRLPSGEVRYIDMNCMATVGQVSQPLARQPEHGQGRPQPLAGQAPHGARLRDAPGGPPARWWRRPLADWHGRAQDALGQARAG